MVNLVFFGSVVYFNLIYLIPQYLLNKKILTYILLFILTVLIVTPIRNIAFHFIYSDFPYAQIKLKQGQLSTYLTMFGIGSISTLFKISTEWYRQQRDRQMLITQTMQSELNFLKSQINPHFLFNTLNNLYALTLKKSDHAPEIVLKLSEMMRYMLYECNEKKVSLEKEIKYIKNYLDLERIRKGEEVDINFQLHGNTQNKELAPLLFLPFIENSFKHGISNNIHDAYVHINLEVEDNDILFQIENTKPEKVPVRIHKKSGGIGLKNVRRRLDILYPGQYELEINDNPNTYNIELKLNLEN